jgi:iron(III) transport system substrate-binding protein
MLQFLDSCRRRHADATTKQGVETMITRRTAVQTLGAATLLAAAAPARAQQQGVGIYTAHRADIVERMIPDFEKATGIKAEVVKAGSGDIINRVRAERNNPQADVIWSIGGELLEANADLLEPYAPKEIDQVDPAFISSQAWIPYTGIVTVVMANTQKLQPDAFPKTWLDLADPRFKGQISSAGADKSGSAYIQLATILTIYGDTEEGWQKYASIFKNFNIAGSSGAVPRFVNDGEAMIGLTLEDNAYNYLKGGGPVAIIYPEDGTSVLADGMALVKGAPRPEAGKAFIDWALSAPTQDLAVRELGRRPIRKDGTPPEGLKPLSEIKLVDYDITWAGNKRDEFLEKWNELLLAR